MIFKEFYFFNKIPRNLSNINYLQKYYKANAYPYVQNLFSAIVSSNNVEKLMNARF